MTNEDFETKYYELEQALKNSQKGSQEALEAIIEGIILYGDADLLDPQRTVDLVAGLSEIYVQRFSKSPDVDATPNSKEWSTTIWPKDWREIHAEWLARNEVK